MRFLKTPKSFKVFLLIITVIFGFTAVNAEYKIKTPYNVFDMPGVNDWESGDEYSIKTAWEATGEETCDPWSPEAIDQIMDFTQEQTCGVQEARDVTVREYNTSFDVYQQLSQKASPNTGGDEWLCSLFLRTHFLC